jgi:hypothetical protein
LGLLKIHFPKHSAVSSVWYILPYDPEFWNTSQTQTIKKNKKKTRAMSDLFHPIVQPIKIMPQRLHTISLCNHNPADTDAHTFFKT